MGIFDKLFKVGKKQIKDDGLSTELLKIMNIKMLFSENLLII